MSSGPGESFSDAVDRQLADGLTAFQAPDSAEFLLHLEEQAAADRELQQAREHEQTELIQPVLALGREFVRKLGEQGIGFQLPVAPAAPSQPRRRRQRVEPVQPPKPPKYGAWDVARQTLTTLGERPGQWRDDPVEYYDVVQSRGLAIARDGRFMTYGDHGPYQLGVRTLHPEWQGGWVNAGTKTNEPVDTQTEAKPFDILHPIGAMLWDSDDPWREWFAEKPDTTPGANAVAEKWRSHLVTIATRIILAHQQQEDPLAGYGSI